MKRALLAMLLVASPALAEAPACPPGQPVPEVAHAPVLASGMRVLAIGSSSTSGAGASSREAAYPAQLAARVEGVEIVNAGKGGERAAATFERMLALLDDGAFDLVLWQVGVNDALGDVDEAALAATIGRGVRAARGAGAAVALIDQQHSPRIRDPERYARFVEIVSHVGAAERAAVFPRHAVMAAWDAETLETMLAGDRFHMSDRGYACLAALLAEVLTAP